MFVFDLHKTCCNNRYKLILMDLNMPVMDGYAATSAILEELKRFCVQSKEDHRVSVMHDLSIVAVTAYANEANVNHCRRVGMVDVIHKPVCSDVLAGVIQKFYLDKV